MKNIRICTVVTGKTLNEFLDNLEKIQKISDFVELRVDYIKGFSIDSIETIKSKTIKPAIFTCRKKNEGGQYEGNEHSRKEIIEKAYMMNFEYVDIELSAIEQFHFENNWKTKIILSFHDYEKTPSLQKLQGTKNEMKKYSGVIMKFACRVEDYEDTKTLLKFLLDKQNNEKMIVIGMGEKGKIIRVLGPLLGSYLTFASTPHSQSAPGQINIEEMKNIYKRLGYSV